MQYQVFHEDVELSRLGMGIMRLPQTPEHQIDEPKAMELIRQAYEYGINYFDTAYIYCGGQSETVLASALRGYPRRTYNIADKYNFQASRDYAAQFAEQLEKMKLEYIDFYLLHGIQDNFIDDLLASGCIEYFASMKKQGKIRYFGFSFHGSEESLEKMLAAYPAWDFVQIQLNYYDWEYGNQQALYRRLREKNIPIMVMEPVHGGLLAKTDTPWAQRLLKARPSRTVASWAMRWLLGLEGIQVVLSGMGNWDMLWDNLNTFHESKPLTDSDRTLLRETAAAIHESVAVPCTACRYCVAHCPMQLDIPALLASFNECRMEGANWRMQNLLALPKEKQPAACIACGACTAHCPQSLPLSDTMREMREILAKMENEA